MPGMRGGEMKLTLQKGDFAVGLLVILLAVFMLLFMTFGANDGGQPTLLILQDGAMLYELPLTPELHKTLTIEGKYHNTITIEKGAVTMSESNCPGSDCLHSGWISKPGRAIVCLPNRLELRIVGIEAEIDGVVG